jgi:hypothetical protein
VLVGGGATASALAILALLGLDGVVATACPQSGVPLLVTVADGEPPADSPGVVHFAVAARDWWRDIGFT